jgi:hypothetical protein
MQEIPEPKTDNVLEEGTVIHAHDIKGLLKLTGKL